MNSGTRLFAGIAGAALVTAVFAAGRDGGIAALFVLAAIGAAAQARWEARASRDRAARRHLARRLQRDTQQ